MIKMRKYIVVEKYFNNCGWQPIECFDELIESIHWIENKMECSEKYRVVEKYIYDWRIDDEI